jgi:hypothetical protein
VRRLIDGVPAGTQRAELEFKFQRLAYGVAQRLRSCGGKRKPK